MKCTALVVVFMVFPLMAGDVVNQERPEGEAYTLELIEDLRFGADEDDDNYYWGMTTTKVFPTSNGHMFITDLKENRVIEFDENGLFVKMMTQKGNGPGELQGILGMTILDDGSVIIIDGNPMGMPRFLYFDKNMEFIEQKWAMNGAIPFTGTWSGDGSMLGGMYAQIDMKAGTAWVKNGILNSEFKPVMELTANKQPMPNLGRTDGAYWAQLISERLKMLYGPRGLVAFGPKGRVYAAITTQYRISRYTNQLESPDLSFRRKYKPLPNTDANRYGYLEILMESLNLVPQFKSLITKQVMERALELSDPPIAKSPLYGMIAMEDGHLLAIHDVDLGSRHNLADIFDPNGRFIGQVAVENFGLMGHDIGQFLPRMVFRNGFAYTVHTDEQAEQRVVRYRYRLVPVKDIVDH